MTPHDDYADAAAWAAHPAGPVPPEYHWYGGPYDGAKPTIGWRTTDALIFGDHPDGRYVRDDDRREWRWVATTNQRRAA
jgi:hypothetical protein